MKARHLLLNLVLSSLIALPGGLGWAQEPIATATPTAKPTESRTLGETQVGTAKLAPLTVTVDLIGGTKITGTLTDVTELPFRCAAFQGSISMSEIAGVKLASTEDTTTTVIFKNGDSVTGATDLKVITVDTEWGSAKINGSSIVSILLIPDLKWSAAMGLNGKRWSLVDSKTVTPTAPSTTGQTTQPRNSSGTLQSSPTIGR